MSSTTATREAAQPLSDVTVAQLKKILLNLEVLARVEHESLNIFCITHSLVFSFFIYIHSLLSSGCPPRGTIAVVIQAMIELRDVSLSFP